VKTKFYCLASFMLAIIAFTMYGCGKNKFIADVCFNKNIKPIFISKCTSSGCHSASVGNKKGLDDFTTYEGIMKKVKPYYPMLSDVYTQCRGNNPSMPPLGAQKLTVTELEYIKYWIHTGAKNEGDCGAVASCDTLNFTFSARVLPILNTWCIGCHNAANSGGGYDLSNYAGVVSAITPDNRLIGSMNQLVGFSAMPQGSSKIDNCDISAIQRWINAGNPNN
jgi:hypothetical protein